MDSEYGLTPRRVPHLRFALVLCMAIFFEKLTDFFILTYTPERYEPAWFMQPFHTVLDPYIGVILTTVIVVTVLTALSIAIDLAQLYVPAVTGRDTVCYWGSLAVYMCGTVYYVYTALQNILLLVT